MNCILCLGGVGAESNSILKASSTIRFATGASKPSQINDPMSFAMKLSLDARKLASR